MTANGTRALRLQHLNCGTLQPAGGVESFGSDKLVCHCLLVETPSRLILVEAGVGLRDIAEPAARLQPSWLEFARPLLDADETAARQLERRGLAPKDVTDIVLTHFDRDHAGGIADFPHARIHLAPEGRETVIRPGTPRDVERLRTRQWDHHVAWAPSGPQIMNWYGVRGAAPLDGCGDDILLIPLPGHCTGHAGVAIRTPVGYSGAQWLLHAGDAYFHRNQTHFPERDVPPGIEQFENTAQQSGALRRKTQHYLTDLIHNYPNEVSVFCSHDPEELKAFQARSIAQS